MPLKAANILYRVLPLNWSDVIDGWLHEDLSSFDYAACLLGDCTATAVLFMKSEGVLAGVPFFDGVFNKLGCQVEWQMEEGSEIEPLVPKPVAYVRGPYRNLLRGERLALNILGRCSGIATRCRRLKSLVQAETAAGQCRVAGTRKTTPGFRLVEKYGMMVGGADTHRFDLSSLVMIKDNHLAAWKNTNADKEEEESIQGAIERVRQFASATQKIEVECRTERQARAAIHAGADIVMLDNMGLDTLSQCLPGLRDCIHRSSSGCLIEASGGISEQNIALVAKLGVDIISTSCITENFRCIDFSLKIST